jgi:hypothetical protein
MARRNSRKSSEVALRIGVCRQCGDSGLDSRIPGNSFWVSPYLCSSCAPPALVEQTRVIIQRNLPYCMGEALEAGDPMPPNLSASCEWGLHAICDHTGRMRAQVVTVGKDGVIELPNEPPPTEPCECECHFEEHSTLSRRS